MTMFRGVASSRVGYTQDTRLSSLFQSQELPNTRAPVGHQWGLIGTWSDGLPHVLGRVLLMWLD